MRRLWHNNAEIIERKRYFEPLTTTTALAGLAALGGTAGVGAGIWSLFGGGANKSKNDPLAGLREQLQGIATRQTQLAEKVPGLVKEQKRILGERFGAERERGIQDIGENVYAERGFGRTSIFDRLRTELVDKLARSQAEAELNAELGGLKLQGDIYGQTANVLGSTSGMYPTEEPSTLSKILEMGAGLVGEEMGFNRLTNMFSPTKTSTAGDGTSFFRPETWADILASRKGAFSI